MFPFDDNSVDYATSAELLTVSMDEFMNDGTELLEWSIVAQSLLALFPNDFPSPSFSSETSYGSNFTEFEHDFNSRPSDDNLNIVDEHSDTLMGATGETSPTESNAGTIGTSSTVISRCSLSPLKLTKPLQELVQDKSDYRRFESLRTCRKVQMSSVSEMEEESTYL
jgi:hypothetical protein